MSTLHSRLTSKGQATIPAAVRRELGLKQGDQVAFVIEEDRVVLRKATQLDRALLALASEAFDDWNDPAADEAFRDL